MLNCGLKWHGRQTFATVTVSRWCLCDESLYMTFMAFREVTEYCYLLRCDTVWPNGSGMMLQRCHMQHTWQQSYSVTLGLMPAHHPPNPICKYSLNCVRFEVLVAVVLKVLRDVMVCHWLWTFWCYRGFACLQLLRVKQLPTFWRMIVSLSTLFLDFTAYLWDEGNIFLRNTGTTHHVTQCHILEELNLLWTRLSAQNDSCCYVHKG